MKSNKYFPVDEGLIQFVSNETFIMHDQRHLNFKVERLQSSKGKARVYWRVVQGSHNSSNAFGTVEFEYGEIQKNIKVPFSDTILDETAIIELFNQTEKYKLGKIKIAKISRVCK